jgi:hypothetical protein
VLHLLRKNFDVNLCRGLAILQYNNERVFGSAERMRWGGLRKYNILEESHAFVAIVLPPTLTYSPQLEQHLPFLSLIIYSLSVAGTACFDKRTGERGRAK